MDTRRDFLKFTGMLSAATALPLPIRAAMSTDPFGEFNCSFGKLLHPTIDLLHLAYQMPLATPQTLKPKFKSDYLDYYEVTAHPALMQILPDGVRGKQNIKSNIWGYNGITPASRLSKAKIKTMMMTTNTTVETRMINHRQLEMPGST